MNSKKTKEEQIENEAKLLSQPILKAYINNDPDELQKQVYLICKELIERRACDDNLYRIKNLDTGEFVKIVQTNEESD